MIKVYPTEVEAIYDEQKVFTLSMVSDHTFTLRVDSLVCEGNLDALFDAIRKAVKILEIER